MIRNFYGKVNEFLKNQRELFPFKTPLEFRYSIDIHL